MMIPPMLGVVLICFSAFHFLRIPISDRAHKTWKEFFLKETIKLLVLTVGTLYTLLLVTVVSPFKCVESETYYVLWDLPGVKCFNGEWYSWLPAFIFFFLSYGIMLPTILIAILVSKKKQLSKEEFEKLFGSFIKNYKDDYFWWGLVVVSKRAAFALTSAFMKMNNSEILSGFVTVLILCVFLWIEVRNSPFKEASDLYISSA
jgi:hypothetical protein